MFSVVSVCHSVHKGGCNVTITRDVLELTIQVALSPLLVTSGGHDLFKLVYVSNPYRGGSRIPRSRGRQHMILPNFAKNCMKVRKFWAVVGARTVGAPTKSATALVLVSGGWLLNQIQWESRAVCILLECLHATRFFSQLNILLGFELQTD